MTLRAMASPLYLPLVFSFLSFLRKRKSVTTTLKYIFFHRFESSFQKQMLKDLESAKQVEQIHSKLVCV